MKHLLMNDNNGNDTLLSDSHINEYNANVVDISKDERVHFLSDEQPDVWAIIRKLSHQQNHLLDEENKTSAFYVCDVGDIIHKYQLWHKILPDIHPYYSVKANDSLIVLEILAALGTNFQCATKREMELVLSLNVKPNRIMFSNPIKPVSHIQYAAATGVATITFSTETELLKIKKFHPTAKLMLHIGCECQLEDVLESLERLSADALPKYVGLLELAKSLELTVVGVGFRIDYFEGRYNMLFRSALVIARELFVEAWKLGFENFKFLNIGDDFLRSCNFVDLDVNQRSQVVMSDILESFPSLKLQYGQNNIEVVVIAEPGRFFVESAYTLCCCIQNAVSSETNAGETDITTKRTYVITEGIFGSFGHCLLDNLEFNMRPFLDSNEIDKREILESSVWGPTSDSMDCVINQKWLPEMQEGEWLIFEHMGAYTLSASKYVEIKRPQVHIALNWSMWQFVTNTLKVPFKDNHFKNVNNAEIVLKPMGAIRAISTDRKTQTEIENLDNSFSSLTAGYFDLPVTIYHENNSNNYSQVSDDGSDVRYNAHT